MEQLDPHLARARLTIDRAMLLALVAAHPAPENLRAAFIHVSEQAIATELATGQGEEAWRAMQLWADMLARQIPSTPALQTPAEKSAKPG